MKKGFVVVVILILVIAVVGVGAYLLIKKPENIVSPIENIVQEKVVHASPSPIPFVELTMPYLRERKWESSLTNLSQVSTNSAYTSYLTSYTSDGLKINGYLTKPGGEMPSGGWPAIIFIHGYIPPTQYRTLVNYASYVDYLAKNGFVVFKIDLRGHADSEGEPGGAYYSSDYIIDALNAHAALQNSDFVNKDSIGLWGHSMAGNVVFKSFVAKKDIPAVVIWSGAVYTYTDFQEFGIDDDSYRAPSQDSERARKRKLLFDTYGDFSADSDFWRQVVPTNYLDGVFGAVQVHHATNDNVVSVDYSRNLMRVLDLTPITHRLWEYDEGGHNLTGSTFNTAMQRTVDFFKSEL